MELQRQISLLERAASIERGAIRTSYKIAVVVFAAGVVGALLVNRLVPTEGDLKLVLTICTLLSSFFSGIPIKDVATKKLKIEAIYYLKSEYEHFQTSPDADEQLLSEINKLFFGFVNKNS